MNINNLSVRYLNMKEIFPQGLALVTDVSVDSVLEVNTTSACNKESTSVNIYIYICNAKLMLLN